MPILCEILSYSVSYLFSYLNISLLLNKKLPKFVILIGFIAFSLAVFIPSSFNILYYFIVLFTIFSTCYKNIPKVISAIIFNYFTILVLELLASLILTGVDIKNNYHIRFIASNLISIFSFVLIRKKTCLQLWNLIQNHYEKYAYVLITIIFALIYISVGYRYNVINISILIVFILVLTYLIIKGLVQSHIMKIEAERMLEYVENYEKQLDDFKISQHEYKNTLICIRQMIPKNKKAIGYIDSILNTKSNEECIILNGLEKLNTSPIKGLIYYKLIDGRKQGIYTVLNISSGIDFNKLNKIDINILKDTTIILGILLDNAIEACIETSQKSLSLYMYQENNHIVFQISNTFKGSINIDLLNNPKYSTKGKNRGYGLALAKKTIKENNKLSMSSEISNDIFIQSLKLELD